jgi:hypothetical protein
MNTLHKEFLMKTFILAGVVCALALPAFGATSSKGCDNPNNDRINPEIALCSTHVYNIGGNTGPDGSVYNFSDESNQQLMRDVIALKTTVMTQQMYKQYEYLDATLKRFKTQLEKAVLTTKLAAAGADVSSGSSYSGISTGNSTYRSTDKNIRLAGAQNCMTTTSYQNAYSCLSSNIQLILNAVNGGNSVGEAKRQLEVDLGVAATWEIIYGSAGKYSTAKESVSGFTNCNSLRNTRDSVIGCAQELNVAIARSLDNRQQRQNTYNRNNQQP